MSIIFKPNGSLDVATDPSDLPSESEGKNIISYAMQRCKNLRLDNLGVAKTRHGSQKLSDTILDGIPEFVFVNNDKRYIFTTNGIVYGDETALIGGACEAPVFSPGDGGYTVSQTVTMTTGTLGAVIYYTINGSTPSESSLQYTGPIQVALFTQLKAISIRTGFVDSSVSTAYYTGIDAYVSTETDMDTIVTETDANNVTNEGDA